MVLTRGIILSSLPARRIVPAVGAPKFSFPGLALAYAISCGIVSTGSDGVTETRFGTRRIPATGAMSRMKLKLSLSKSAGLIAALTPAAQQFLIMLRTRWGQAGFQGSSGRKRRR